MILSSALRHLQTTNLYPSLSTPIRFHITS